MNKKIKKINLELHSTKDINDQHENGSLTVIHRDWDGIISEPINMVYVSSVNKGEIKGPHLHTRRNSYFVCIHGKVVFITKNESGNYVEIESSSENPTMVFIPKGVPSAHVNLSDDISRVLTITDLAWRPNDNEMENVIFSNYDWQKWLKNSKTKKSID